MLRKDCGKVDISSSLHLNMEQLIKSLTSLYDLYVINQRSSDKNYNEAEFYSFYLILQLGRNSQVILSIQEFSCLIYCEEYPPRFVTGSTVI